jgi:hypothetical protein
MLPVPRQWGSGSLKGPRISDASLGTQPLPPPSKNRPAVLPALSRTTSDTAAFIGVSNPPGDDFLLDEEDALDARRAVAAKVTARRAAAEGRQLERVLRSHVETLREKLRQKDILLTQLLGLTLDATASDSQQAGESGVDLAEANARRAVQAAQIAAAEGASAVRHTPFTASSEAAILEVMRLRRDLLNGQRALVQLSDANASLRVRDGGCPRAMLTFPATPRHSLPPLASGRPSVTHF